MYYFILFLIELVAVDKIENWTNAFVKVGLIKDLEKAGFLSSFLYFILFPKKSPNILKKIIGKV